MSRTPSSAILTLTLTLGAWLAFAGPAPKTAAPSAQGTAAPEAQVEGGAAAPADSVEATDATIVYLGKSGSRYHAKGCRYLKGAGKEITIGEAIKKGFAPCNVCKAPRVKH